MGKGQKGALALCKFHEGGIDIFRHIHHLAHINAVQPRGQRAVSFVTRFVRPGGKRGKPAI